MCCTAPCPVAPSPRHPTRRPLPPPLTHTPVLSLHTHARRPPQTPDLQRGAAVPQIKFTGGDKCWNGPKRFALVDVFCGPVHALLSSDEPETCVYHFEMVSPLACTEEYARGVGVLADSGWAGGD